MNPHTTATGRSSAVAAEAAFDAMPAAGPDAVLLQAVADWRLCVEQHATADQTFCDRQIAFDDAELPLPEALRVQPDDREILHHHFPILIDLPAGEPLPDDVITRMRARPMCTAVREPCPAEWGEHPEAYIQRGVPDPVAQARADAVVAAFVDYEATDAVLRVSLGLDTAEAEYKASASAALEAIKRVASIPATTLAGLIEKAAAFADYQRAMHADDESIADDPSEGELCLLLSIARDAAALAPASTRGNS